MTTFTTTQVAEKLGYSTEHVRELLRRGVIRGERFNQSWAIDQAEVERIQQIQGAGRLNVGAFSKVEK